MAGDARLGRAVMEAAARAGMPSVARVAIDAAIACDNECTSEERIRRMQAEKIAQIAHERQRGAGGRQIF